MAKLTIRQSGKTREVEFAPPKLLSHVLEQENIQMSHPCGGRGTCGKCKVTLTGCVSEPNPMEKRIGARLACQAVLLGDAAVWLREERAMEQIELSGTDGAGELQTADPMEGEIGAAVDIGTTTVALVLYDLKTGKLLGQASGENPQRRIAADVMGRIQAALEGKGETLRTQISDFLEVLLKRACDSADPPGAGNGVGCRKKIDAMVMVGNTTMLYLLTGKNPACLAGAPFQADDLFDRTDRIGGCRTYLPPCMNAFVGADITAAVLASGMCGSQETALLCDIGTNGEIALWKDGLLYVTSTAAGPAFEGADISCGCGSIRGAVDKVWIEDGEVRAHTIGEVEPVGVCGSGLIDAIAVYLERGEIDETGATERDSLPLGGEVALLPGDVRAVQLAKAAIAAGMETLMREAGVEVSEVKRLYLAGGFGSHLSIGSAVRIGLLPEELRERVVVLGNAALAGAVRMLVDRSCQDEAREIAAHSVHVALSGNRLFNERFVDRMMFE